MHKLRLNDFVKHSLLNLTSIAALICASSVYAAGEMERLTLFKGGAMQTGQWQTEMLSSSDPERQESMAKMGKMSICVDIAKQMAKSGTQQSQCSTKVIRNTADVAEVEASCESGMHSHMIMTRESKDSYLIETKVTSKDGKPHDFKARYTYQGPCKSDSLLQMDKNSEACKKMNSEAKGMDMSAMCAQMPAERRAQCEQQMKQMQAACQ